MDWALPWHQDCYQGIMQYGQEQGWRCVLDLTATGMHGDPTRTDYDGVIGRIPHEVVERATGFGLPMVHLTKYVAPGDHDRFEGHYGVFVDPQADARMAVEHLVENGYPRIGMVTESDPRHQPAIDAATSACLQHGAAWMEPFRGPKDVPAEHAAQVQVIRDLMAFIGALDKPVGLVMDPDFYAVHAAHVCVELGIKVPEEVGIIALPASPITLTSSWPTISSVEFDFFKQGYEAAGMLDRLMAGKKVDPMQQYLKPTHVTVRDSTDVFLCEDEVVSKAMRWIASRVREELNVSQVADAVGVSRTTLYRRFEEALGKSPQDEMTRLRLKYVKRLLSETELSITDVADTCGFSASSHLSRLFKRELGMTPTAYREQHDEVRARDAEPSGRYSPSGPSNSDQP